MNTSYESSLLMCYSTNQSVMAALEETHMVLCG